MTTTTTMTQEIKDYRGQQMEELGMSTFHCSQIVICACVHEISLTFKLKDG